MPSVRAPAAGSTDATMPRLGRCDVIFRDPREGPDAARQDGDAPRRLDKELNHSLVESSNGLPKLVPANRSRSIRLKADMEQEDPRMAYDWKLISSGPNRPGIDLSDRSTIDAALRLHSSTFGAANVVDNRIAADRALAPLIEERLAQFVSDDQAMLRFPVITAHDAAIHFAPPAELVDAIAGTIVHALPDIVRFAQAIPGLRGLPFEAISLFVLSNVLMDEFQIVSVERALLGADRPERGGGGYYAALMQRCGQHVAFGIYGNEAAGCSGIGIHSYGRRSRVGGVTLTTLDRDRIVHWGFAERDDPAAIGRILAAHLVRLAATPDAGYPECVGRALHALELLSDQGKRLAPVLVNTDLAALGILADRFAETLIPTLSHYLPEARRQFGQSPYADGRTTFQEWYIWWYHFLYTAVTDRLAEMGIVIVPVSGRMTYLTYHRR